MKYLQTLIAITIVLIFCGSFVFGENAIYQAEHIMQCASWELVFYESGFVHEKWNNSCGEESQSFSRLHRINKDQLEYVRKALSQAKFAELPNSIEPSTYISDEDMYAIHDYSGKSTKKVAAIGLPRAVNREVASRFSQVWHVIDMIIHEPSSK